MITGTLLLGHYIITDMVDRNTLKVNNIVGSCRNRTTGGRNSRRAV